VGALQVSLSTGDTGVIEGSFGKSGKLKVRVPAGVSDATSQQMLTNKERGEGACRVIVYLDFKKSVFDAKKGMIQ
jgi:selenocysteine-specific elongation factor